MEEWVPILAMVGMVFLFAWAATQPHKEKR
jgi:hypothetical protein